MSKRSKVIGLAAVLLVSAVVAYSQTDPFVGPVDMNWGEVIRRSVEPLPGFDTTYRVRTIRTPDTPDGEFGAGVQTGIHSGNSTTTPLGAAGTFTGECLDVSKYSDIAVMVNSDVDSATDGLRIQQSMDACATIHDSKTFSVFAGKTYQTTLGLKASHVRVQYVNGATPQTTFSLQTKVYTNRPKPSSDRVRDNIDGQDDAELVKAVLTGRNPNDLFINSRLGGVVNSNSTTTPLGAAGTFTGAFIDQSGYGGITVAVLSNVAGTLFIDSSADGVSTQSTQTYTVAAATPFFIGSATRTQYVRARYENGGTPQASFSMQTIIFTQQLSPSSQPINVNLTPTSIATTVRSVLAGQRENGIFANVGLSNSGSVKVAVTDRPSEVRGRTRVVFPINRTVLPGAPGSTIYTVTPGKTLYISSFLVTALNSANADGEFRLRDGTGTVHVVYLIPQRVSGSSPSSFTTTSPTLPEPLPFSTSVNFIGITGTVAIGGYMIGYEE